MERELRHNLATGVALIGVITAIVTLILLVQLAGLDIGVYLGFRNIPVF